MSADTIALRGTELSGKAGTEVEAARPGKRGRRIRIVARYLLLTILAVIVLFPIYITIVNSLLLPSQIASTSPTFFPTSPQWHTYADAWSDGHLARYLANSAVVTIFVTVGQLAIATCAGYAFAFLQFPFRRTLFIVFLTTLMIPVEITIITHLSTVNTIGWYDTYQGLIVPLLATGALGFGAFLMRQAFLQVPKDLQDAAKLDGYGHLRFMTRVAVPLVRPTLAALSVFSFLAAWNQYLWPLLLTKDDRLRHVHFRRKQLRATSIAQVNFSFAGTVIAFIPLVSLLLIFQKQLVRGLTAGAVKG